MSDRPVIVRNAFTRSFQSAVVTSCIIVVSCGSKVMSSLVFEYVGIFTWEAQVVNSVEGFILPLGISMYRKVRVLMSLILLERMISTVAAVKYYITHRKTSIVSKSMLKCCSVKDMQKRQMTS